MNDKTTSLVEAINHVQSAFAQVGIEKTHRNTQGWMYRSIDDMYGILNKALREAGLAIIPIAAKHTSNVVEIGAKKTRMVHVVVRMKYEIRHYSGNRVTAATMGESLDSGDKATAKAQTAAYKTFLSEIFSIPFTGEPDPDSENHGEETLDLITEEQVADLVTLLHDAKMGQQGFFKWVSTRAKMDITTLEEIPAKMYADILVMVENT